MTDPHQIDRRPATKFELLIDFVKFRFWSIIMAGAGLGAVGIFLGIDPEVPRWAKLFGLTFLVISPAGYMTGKKVVSLLWEPNYVYLLDIDARYQTGALYRFPFEHFHELEVVAGELDQLTSSLYIGKAVDLEEMTVRGTWRGTLTDRELLTALHKVDQCFGQLREDAKAGFAWENNAFTIIYNATRTGVRRVVETFEQGTLPDEGEGLGDAVDEALERYDLEQEVEELEEDLDLDREELERDRDQLDRDRGDRADQGDAPDPQPEAPADD